MASPRKLNSQTLLSPPGELGELTDHVAPFVPAEKIRTAATDLFKINHPILLAGMNVAAGPRLAAAVSNAGGLGVIGGVNYTPDMLRDQIEELKSHLTDKNAPFCVDLLLPQVGGNARKTKYVLLLIPFYFYFYSTISR